MEFGTIFELIFGLFFEWLKLWRILRVDFRLARPRSRFNQLSVQTELVNKLYWLRKRYEKNALSSKWTNFVRGLACSSSSPWRRSGPFLKQVKGTLCPRPCALPLSLLARSLDSQISEKKKKGRKENSAQPFCLQSFFQTQNQSNALIAFSHKPNQTYKWKVARGK